MKIKYELRHTDSKAPVRATEGSLGLDLYAATLAVTDGYIEYDTGVAFEFEPGWGAEVFARSSVSKTDLILCNGTALIDQDFSGTVKLRFRDISKNPTQKADAYKVGDRIGQIVFRKYEKVTLEQTSRIEESESRGSQGFGSTGVKDLHGEQKQVKPKNTKVRKGK